MFWSFETRLGFFELCILVAKRRSTQVYSTKRFALVSLALNWALSSVTAPVNGFLFQFFLRVTLIFTLAPSKQRFNLF